MGRGPRARGTTGGTGGRVAGEGGLQVQREVDVQRQAVASSTPILSGVLPETLELVQCAQIMRRHLAATAVQAGAPALESVGG